MITGGLEAGDKVIARPAEGRGRRPGQGAARSERGQQQLGRQARGRARACRGEEATDPHMPKTFIEHPVFAWVVAILISLSGE